MFNSDAKSQTLYKIRRPYVSPWKTKNPHSYAIQEFKTGLYICNISVLLSHGGSVIQNIFANYRTHKKFKMSSF